MTVKVCFHTKSGLSLAVVSRICELTLYKKRTGSGKVSVSLFRDLESNNSEAGLLVLAVHTVGSGKRVNEGLFDVEGVPLLLLHKV